MEEVEADMCLWVGRRVRGEGEEGEGSSRKEK